MSWIPQRSHSDASLNYQFIFEQETTMLKEYIKWEWSLQILWEWCSQCKGLLFEWQKRNHAKQKPSCNEDCRMGIAKLCCLLPGKRQDFPACPCLPGPHKVSSALLEAGIASVPALCGWVTGLSLGGCQEEHLGPVFSDLLHSSTRSSGLHLITPLCSSYHTTVEIPHYKDADNKSPGSDGWFVSCCAGPLRLRAYPKWELCS